MKKFYFVCALGGLLLASCANDDIVNPAEKVTPTDEVPMSFSFATTNASRATNLEAEMYNFGVWGVKVDNDTEYDGIAVTSNGDANTDPHAVMMNYLVGYNDATAKKGYYNENPTAVPVLFYGSKWFYEKLGSTQYAHTNAEGENYFTTSVSNNQKQYLKYWDGKTTMTSFFAYAPYVNGANTPVLTLAGKGKEPELQFSSITTNSGECYMYGGTTADNSKFVEFVSTNVARTVPIKMHRIQSRVQIAFWENIEGYQVKMGSVNLVASGGNAAGTNLGAVAIPFDFDGVNYTRGAYVNAVTPKVTFDVSGGVPAATTAEILGELTYAGNENGSANLLFSTSGLTPVKPNNGTAVEFIGTTQATKVYSPTVYNVNPVKKSDDTDMFTGVTNSGLQFVFDFTLYSEDTGETIHVKNARVNVPATDTQWKANTLYTYVFRITRNATGNTKGTEPKNDPEAPEVKALFPIVFDGITIEDEAGVEKEYNVN